MSKFKALVGHNVKIVVPKTRIMLHRDDVLQEHRNAASLCVLGCFGTQLIKASVFKPEGDPVPDQIRGMKYYDGLAADVYVHVLTTRAEWTPRNGQVVHLFNSKGMKLPWDWELWDCVQHDADKSLGQWVMLHKIPQDADEGPVNMG